MKQVKNMLTTQIANAGGSGIWNGFSYDNAKCPRDIGLITDAIIWDIKHGGNERPREMAQSILVPAGASYVLGQEANTVEVINYANTMMQRIVQNLTVTTNYQNLNSEPKCCNTI